MGQYTSEKFVQTYFDCNYPEMKLIDYFAVKKHLGGGDSQELLTK